MNVYITDWGLDSYLELKHSRVFTDQEYGEVIRPDALLLQSFPLPTKFANDKFWGPAEVSGNIIPDGFKMKWHQVGPGRVQLRLPVARIDDAYLCAAYVKRDAKVERRQLAKFKTHLELIRVGNVHVYGRLR